VISGDVVGAFVGDLREDPAVVVIGVTGQSAMTNRGAAISIPPYVLSDISACSGSPSQA
jgi:hypothetical protein